MTDAQRVVARAPAVLAIEACRRRRILDDDFSLVLAGRPSRCWGRSSGCTLLDYRVLSAIRAGS
jgi:hypothetical protein